MDSDPLSSPPGRAAADAAPDLAALERRVAELRRANEALRRGVTGLARLENLDGFMGETLRTAASLAGAQSGAVLLINPGGQTYRCAALLTRGALVPPDTLLAREVVMTPAFRRWLRVMESSPAGWPLAPDSPLHEPEVRAYHAAEGNRALRHIPMHSGGRLVGWLGLGFADPSPELGEAPSFLQSLADQTTLAVETARLSEEARQSAVARERAQATQERAAELTRNNAAMADALSKLVELPDLRGFLRDVFGQCARLTGAVGGGLFFHDPAAGTLGKQLGWIKGEVIDFGDPAAAAGYWREPVPAATIPDWAESVQIDPRDERIWPGARPWHRAQGYGWLCRVPVRAGAQPFGFMGMAFARREDLTAEKAELICAVSHQIALAVQLDRLARSSEQAAVTREQEKAAREQAAELARANGVLRRGVEQLSNPHSIRDILDQFLFEAVGVANAAAGAVLQRVGDGTEFVLRSLTQDGTVVRDFGAFTSDQAYRRATGEDLAGIMRRTVNGESFYFPVASMERWFPEVIDYHRAHGHRTIGHFPFGVGGEITGYLALGFRGDGPPGTVPTETVRTLASQASLALETQRLADEAKEAAVLAERNRIARDLHDVLAQGFVGVLTQVGVLEGALEAADVAEVARVTQRVRAIARDGLEEARRSVHALRPLRQEDSLRERLRTIVAALTAGSSLRADVGESGTPASLSEQADWAAVKFVQQALANALRYAAAETFSLTLAWTSRGLTLTARDDGRGFTTAAPRHGMGLRAMDERAAECGGSLQVASAPGAGTVLRLFLPSDRAAIPPPP